jgi:hypothetical protein
MRVEATHTLGRDKARQRLEGVVEGLVSRPWPGGVAVRNVTRSWAGDQLIFSFVLARGFFSATIAGHLCVDDTVAVIETEVPRMIVTFVGEDRIRDVIRQELEDALADSQNLNPAP